MKYNIRGNKIEVTDAIDDYIRTKVSKLEKYLDDNDEVEAKALISAKGKDQKVEVTIWSGKYNIRAEETNEDLYAAIDLVVDVLERQIRKNKTRLNKRRDAADVVFSFIPEEDEEYTETNQIVKRKTIEKKPMSEEEAILQMELLDYEFFLYNDVDKKSFAVLY